MIRFIDEKEIIAPLGGAVSADIAITAFSTQIFTELLARTGAKRSGVVKGSIDLDVYIYESNGKRVAVYQSPVGAPGAVGAMEEIMACGVKHIIAFGICGMLEVTPPHTLIVPNRAYRDEGTSYHYMPQTDYIDIVNSGVVEKSIKDGGVDVLVGGVWTTDGFYRETRTRAEEMKSFGCVSVDMECSALQAAANFRGNNFYTFFISADSLAGENWQPNDILDLRTSACSTSVECAMRLAAEIASRE